MVLDYGGMSEGYRIEESAGGAKGTPPPPAPCSYMDGSEVAKCGKKISNEFGIRVILAA